MNREAMLAPFAEEELHKTHPRQGGFVGTYIEDETVMDRLDLGYGPGNWQVKVDAISENVAKVRLGVRETPERDWVWYEDFGYNNREGGESLKEAVTDGIRRCGRFVGIARDLYRKPTSSQGDQRPPPPHLPPREDPATNDPKPSRGKYEEKEEMIGRIRRQGIVRKGTSAGYKLEARQGPDGHVIGFRLDVGKDKSVPQVLVAGPAGEALWLLTAGHPETLIGTPITVAGILHYVKGNRTDESWYRVHVDWWQNAEAVFPADPEPVLPEPPDDVPLAGEALPEPMGLG